MIRIAGAGALLRSGTFLPYVLQSTFGICIFFSFIAGAPYFMMDVLRRSATEYGLWFILVSAAFMTGNLVAGRFSARIGLDRMVLTGSLLGVAGAGLAFALLLAGFWMPLALFGPIMAVGLGNGFAVPNAQAGAVSVQPLLAGTASGLAGFSQMFVAAVVSQAVGMLQNGTPYRWERSWPAARCSRWASPCAAAGQAELMTHRDRGSRGRSDLVAGYALKICLTNKVASSSAGPTRGVGRSLTYHERRVVTAAGKPGLKARLDMKRRPAGP